MRILALPALYLVYKGLTRGVSPVIIQPDEPPTKLGLFTETEEFKQQQKEAEDARRKAEEESVRKQKESDRKAAEDKQKALNEYFKRQAEIKANPPNCGRGKSPRLRGAGTLDKPWYWECILTGF